MEKLNLIKYKALICNITSEKTLLGLKTTYPRKATDATSDLRQNGNI